MKMSSNVKQLVSSRSNYRGQVTKIHSELANFSSKTESERNTLITKLKRLEIELDSLDREIRDLKWASAIDEKNS